MPIEMPPLPSLDDDIVPFWEGLKRHEFLLFTCQRCGTRYWPYAYCRNHEDIPRLEEMEWRPASGRGKVFSVITVHQVTNPVWADDVPYPLALVELEEGPLFGTRIVDCKAEDVYIGMPVEVSYQDVAEHDYVVPLFKPST